MMSVDCADEEAVEITLISPHVSIDHISETPASEKPHAIACRKNCCERKWLVDRSEEALTYYRRVTRPEELANEKDPLRKAFALTHEIRERENNSMEARQEWRELVRKCKQFTVDLLDECRDGNEVAALFNFEKEDLLYWINTMKDGHHRNASHFVQILREAVEAHHFEFVSHRHSQQLLNSVIYSSARGIPNYLQKLSNAFVTFPLMCALFMLSFPILVTIFLVSPHCYVSLRMKIPFYTFLSQVSQFCVFLGFLVWSVLKDAISVSGPSIPGTAIMVFILAMTGQEIWQIRRERSKYFYKWWNWILALMLLFFLVSGFLFVVALAVDAGQLSAVERLKFYERNSRVFFLLSNSCFTIATVMSIFYLGALCQVNSALGPLELSILRMVKDILKFLAIFLGIFIAFTLGVRNLYSYNPGLIRQRNGTIHTHHRLGSFRNATITMFWALFDQTDLEQFEGEGVDSYAIIPETGKILFGLFLIIAVLVGINMLIAMMNKSYEIVTQDENSKDWKLSRMSLWLDYIRESNDHRLPPPYNVIQLPFCVYRTWKGEHRKEMAHEQEQYCTRMADKQERRKQVVFNLTRRYLEHSKENSQIKDLLEETQEKLLKSLKDIHSQGKDSNTDVLYESNV